MKVLAPLYDQKPFEVDVHTRTDTTFWFKFKDDVVIDINAADSVSVLQARSLSRVGISDVGKNAARLQAFFQAMAEGEQCCQVINAGQ